MFTIEQINLAHSQVKSGADFPAYIRDLKLLGVTHYQTFVADGHTNYSGPNGYSILSAAKYATLSIASTPNEEQFRIALKAHQQGKTDYASFCQQAANYGIKKWEVSIDKMTCTYFDTTGRTILVEQIPQ